jgi:2-amino-4-hydroxy-6-hydroxymethyldihydropteridine diphosphokinase
MAKAYLALGANIGDPARQLEEAIRRLDSHPLIDVDARSTVIVTEPWGKTDQPRFHNMAIAVTTALEPLPLLEACLAVEADMGRRRIERWGPRLIDIDIIAYEQRLIDLPSLKVPHPLAHERDFVMTPLREIAPDIAAWLERLASSS